MQNKIALVIPYFGELPPWFPYFAESVAQSPLLDVLLFSDAPEPTNLPANIIYSHSSLADFREMASAQLSIDVGVDSGYKVCDLKPAYGCIFSQYLRDYAFWAFGDIDCIFGDLVHLLSPLLKEYDIIGFRKGWVTGSFCVLRNSDDVNSLYGNSADWIKVATSSGHQHFDELGGHLYADVLNGVDILTVRAKVDSFTHVLTRLSRQPNPPVRCFFADMACESIPWGETIGYHKGRLTRASDGCALMYVHLVYMKRRFFHVPTVPIAPSQFYIRNTGIYFRKPDTRLICTTEVSRILRGGMHGFGRLLLRELRDLCREAKGLSKRSAQEILEGASQKQ